MNVMSASFDSQLICSVPKLAFQVLACFGVLLGLGFFFFAVFYHSLVPAGPGAIKYIIYVFAFVAFAVGLKTFRQPAIVLLKADERGVSFPCPFMQTCEDDFLFVAWRDVGEIGLGKVRTGNGVAAAVTIQIKVSDIPVLNQFFPESVLSSINVGDWYAVGISSAFINKKKCRDKLALLKSRYNDG